MLFSPCLVLGLAALPMCAPNPLISCGQEFLSKGNVGKVEGGKVTSEKSSYIFSFHISCSKEFLYKGNIWGFSSHFLSYSHISFEQEFLTAGNVKIRKPPSVI